MRYRRFGTIEVILALVILAVTAGIIAFKVYALGYTMTTVDSEDGYSVRLRMDIAGNGSDINIRFALPLTTDRQLIKHEKQVSDAFRFTISPGRVGRWFGRKISGKQTITYSCLAQTQARRYPLPQEEDIPTTYSQSLWDELRESEHIQVREPEIQAKAKELAPTGTDVRKAVEAIYNYCYRSVRYVKVSGPTDAVTALRLQEASCNGKNRLLVALLRAKGIPARMANGLILQKTGKRTTHAWSEAWVSGQWIPLCPTNGYFAELPDKYLELAKGDVPILTHTPHIGFDWEWLIRHHLNQREKVVLSNAEHPLNVLRTWTSLKDYHISLDLIMVILMIPIGASVVSIMRNVVGVVPFGTFMPALIAVSFRDTGFGLGAAMFFTVILIGCVANLLLMRLRLLHIPRLVIIITLVVMSIVALSIVCIRHGLASGAAVSLFPMAILSLTTERFTATLLVDGWKAAIQRMLISFFVAAACYSVMSWESLQVLIVAFPELLLANIALNLIIGSWTGMRLTEYFRFSSLAEAMADGNNGERK